MTHETLFEAGTVPELGQLVEAVTRTRREQVILLHGKPVARMVPLRGPAGKPAPQALVDTTALPPVTDSILDDLLTRAPGLVPRSFSDAAIREAVDRDRAEAWHAKQA